MNVMPSALVTAGRQARVVEKNPRLIVPGMPADRRLAIALILAGFATFSLLYGVQPLLPLFALRFGVQAAEASLAVSLATGAMAFRTGLI